MDTALHRAEGASPSGTKRGNSQSISRSTRSSSRTKVAPMHWWIPQPKARWARLARETSKVSGFGKRRGSLFADA